MTRTICIAATRCTALLVLACAACSDTPATTPDGSTDAALLDLRPDQDTVPGPLSVTVYRYDSPADLDPRVPFPGVTVALDRPDGTPEEQTTDAKGKVIFKNVRWSDGAVSCTAYAKGYVVRSVVGLTADYKDLELTMLGRNPEMVTITVLPKNLNADATVLYVTATTGLTYCRIPPTGTCTLAVPPATPFSLIGAHWSWGKTKNNRELKIVPLGWASSDHPGTTVPTTVSLDFSKLLPTTTVTGTIVPPADPTGPLVTRAWGHVTVRSHALLRELFFGRANTTTLHNNGSFDYQAEFVQVPVTPKPYTRYELSVGFGIASYVWEPGYPKNKARVDTFLDLPYMIRPSSSTKPARLHDEIRWTSSETTAIPKVAIFRDGLYLWAVDGIPGATSATVPKLPSAAKADGVLGTTPLDAQVVLCKEPQVKTFDLCMRTAWGRPFMLEPK